jgi:S1-C subfamily serine protease
VLREGTLVRIAVAGLASWGPMAARAQEQPTTPADTAVEAVSARHELPSGYLGITFTCRLKSRWNSDGLAVTHYEYPAVASVEPESPAAKAGIQPGDTIVAYDGRDVRNHVIVLNKLLLPNTHLAITMRRNGQLRDVTVDIARRPRDFVDVSVVSPPPPMAVAPPLAVAIAPTPPGAEAPRPVTARSQPRPVPWWALIGPSMPGDDRVGSFGGAEVVEATPDLREALGVRSGLLVVVVDPDTPAAESSLRAGDVIVSVDGDVVTTPHQLVHIVERTMRDRNSITLQVERQRRLRQVILRW